MEVLPEGWHFLPKHLGKNIKFYKSILVQEKSARIENIINKKGDPSVVLYQKFIITSFTDYQDWGHPSTLKQLKDYKGSKLYYSYYDYMDAFEKVLFYQNKNYDNVQQEVLQDNTSLVPQVVGNAWSNTSDLSRTPPGCP